MKSFLSLGFILLLATSLHAETYSWVDDSGTYNFTEDYSSIPKKYQKKVKWREDLPQDVKPAVIPEGEKELYGGKSRDAWRKELDVQEAELSGIEQRMEQLRRQIIDTKGISKEQFELLKKDYDDSRAAYDQKYKNYSELIDAVRKAGIVVEIKK